MKRYIWISLLAGILLSFGRAIDFALFTDLTTGLCTVGSVWWRYIAVAIAAILALGCGQLADHNPAALSRRHPATGFVAFVGGLCYAGAGVVRALSGSGGSGTMIQVALEILCGFWLMCLWASWQPVRFRPPTKSVLWGIAGSALFYWQVLACFVQNSSSWHRVIPTSAVWQQLAALLFVTSLIRALYLPKQANGAALVRNGLLAFSLCFCWQLPQLTATLMAGQLSAADLVAGMGMCAVGLLGGVCAAFSTRGRQYRRA